MKPVPSHNAPERISYFCPACQYHGSAVSVEALVRVRQDHVAYHALAPKEPA